ncbi:MAG: ATP-dependent DNA helicase DinG [Comamonas sp.]
MSTPDWSTPALQQFDAVVAALPGLRARDGQRRMAEEVARTFARAQLARDGASAEGEEPTRAIAVIEAGTGTGKSLAYAVPAIQMALSRGTRVLIATATVALQEQLVHKDLPALAAAMPEPFSFALAKGRARYVCKLKLERLAGDAPADDDALFPEDPLSAAEQESLEARGAFYTRLADDLATGLWDGDRDQLATPPDPQLWAPVAAVAHTCTGRHCPLFSVCTYYERRKELVAAQVIVANHDLLLSSIGARLLPDLDNCLLIIDEAHHLPKTALSQFACEMDVSRLAWLAQLASHALRVGTQVEVKDEVDVAASSARLRAALQDVERLVIDLYGAPLRGAITRTPGQMASHRERVPEGRLPAPLTELLAQVLQHAGDLLEALRAIASALREYIREEPNEARRLSQLYAQVGQLAPRLEAVHATSALLLQEPGEGGAPAAKWFTLSSNGDAVGVRAHASPVLPGAALSAHLWQRVRGAVLTSATLTSCGGFDFFLREAGLHGDAAVSTLQVASPFDYASQGTLIAHATPAAPREVATFTRQMIATLMSDLAEVTSGALVLFTSREQMRQAVEQLPASLRAAVLVQGRLPRLKLLAQHREHVAQGQASIIFGLQSFAEGTDLPGALCESLFITKLPFAPPDEPVDEARAEWLRASGGDPFMDLVVPATAMRLAQWVGRAIRSEDDRAQVTCYDKRLLHTGYGRRLLRSLPAFTLLERPASAHETG